MEIAKKGGNFGYPRSDRAQLWPRERLTATFTSEDTFMIFTATVDLFGAHKNNNSPPYGKNPTSDHEQV